ncbi:MAG: hypothetical protein ACJAS4_002074 [Bacteriovoracaceae bacterium]|jgi:hypothetical protein
MIHKKIQATLVMFFTATSMMVAHSKEPINSNCYIEDTEEVMFMDMFPWNQSEEQMAQNFNLIYKSNKRMDNRVFYDGENYKMPFNSYGEETRYAIVPKGFIEGLISHMESALDKGYVSHINFSDMGHNHLFIPKEFYKDEIKHLSMVREKHILYEKLMNNSDLLMLYHTAEQLRFFNEDKTLVTDRSVQKRFYTRNLLGKNKKSNNLDILFDLKASANGTSKYKEDQYKYWGAGFSFSSTEKGCFSYLKNGKKLFFDLSINDIGYKPSSYADDDYK